MIKINKKELKRWKKQNYRREQKIYSKIIPDPLTFQINNRDARKHVIEKLTNLLKGHQY